MSSYVIDLQHKSNYQCKVDILLTCNIGISLHASSQVTICILISILKYTISYLDFSTLEHLIICFSYPQPQSNFPKIRFSIFCIGPSLIDNASTVHLENMQVLVYIEFQDSLLQNKPSKQNFQAITRTIYIIKEYYYINGCGSKTSVTKCSGDI